MSKAFELQNLGGAWKVKKKNPLVWETTRVTGNWLIWFQILNFLITGKFLNSHVAIWFPCIRNCVHPTRVQHVVTLMWRNNRGENDHDWDTRTWRLSIEILKCYSHQPNWVASPIYALPRRQNNDLGPHYQ